MPLAVLCAVVRASVLSMAGKRASQSRAKGKAKAKAALPLKKVVKKSKYLIEQTDAADTPFKRRTLRRRDSDSFVKKLIYDHFRDFTDDEVYCIEIDNMSLAARLKQDRKRWKAGELVMGKEYYMNLRDQSKNTADASSLIKFTNSNDKPDEVMAMALEGVVESKCNNIQLFLDWSEFVEEINNLNLVVIYKQNLMFPPLRHNIVTIEFGIATMKLVASNNLHTAHPDAFHVMRDHFNDILEASFVRCRNEGKSALFWWRTHRPAAELLMPPSSLEKCMTCEG